MSLVGKLLVAFALVVGASVVFAVAGVSGWLFASWPTSWPDQRLNVTPTSLARLESLQMQPKFLPDEQLFYPGAATNPSREEADALLNGVLTAVIRELPTRPRRSTLLRLMKPALVIARNWDSEDQERLGSYLNDVIEITGAGGSNQLLTVWRYGLPYGWFGVR